MTDLIITPTACDRIKDIRAQKNNPKLNLRVMVSGGGCSGFKYDLQFDETVNVDDIVFDNCVVTDMVSLPLMKGSKVDYVVTLMGESFKITNPNASSGCGCGESFSL